NFVELRYHTRTFLREPCMRIISLIVNGVEAAAARGLFDWLRTQDADVICLQDIRVTAPELEQDPYWIDGYWQYCFESEVPSQGGVAIYRSEERRVGKEGISR